MSDPRLEAIRAIVQEDPGGRGLRSDPADNLVTRTAGDFAAACASIASAAAPSLAILTGFFIPTATPPAAETDGPLGAVFLARALAPLGIGIFLFTDAWCATALNRGIDACAVDWGSSEWRDGVVRVLPDASRPWIPYLERDGPAMRLTHLIAIERVGPSHRDGRCYSMRGRDITDYTAPGHRLVEEAAALVPPLTTIGIGDGGNEIGMGKIPRAVIARNIPGGDQVACRVATDHLLVAGVSNWGAYGLAAGVRLLRGVPHEPLLFDPDREYQLLKRMTECGPLVDGVTGKREPTVDGLPWEKHADVLRRIDAVLRAG